MKRVIGILLVLLWTAITVSLVASSQASKQAFVQLPLDCHQSRIQSGVPVRRLSDGKITRIDVCGAADSADDSFRNIPYELPQGYPRTRGESGPSYARERLIEGPTLAEA